MALLCKPCSLPPFPPFDSSTSKWRNPRRPLPTLASAAERGGAAPRKSVSAMETRISLVLALASQATSTSQRLLGDLAAETAKHAFPRRFEARNLEEVFLLILLLRQQCLEKLNGSSHSFNVLASYLFGKNTMSELMEITTPVFTRKVQSNGEKLDMTTPVITKCDKWRMSFVMPTKYGYNLPLPKDPAVSIKEVPGKIVAVTAFSGFVTYEDFNRRESKIHEALKTDTQFQVKEDTEVEVAQFNPPFTLPFTWRNEIALEVERKTE